MFNWFKRSSKSVATTRPAQRDEQRKARGGEQRVQEPGRGAAVAVPPGSAAHRAPGRAGATADGRSSDATRTPDPAQSRVAPCATQLGPHAQRILTRLPPEIRLDRTCAQFPHVVDALLRHWSNPAAFRIALDGLMIDSRGNRQGFPFDVLMEFSALRDYYNVSVDPVKKAGWDLTDVR